MGESPQSQQGLDEANALRPMPSAALPLINIGCGKDQTVNELATSVPDVVGYQGEIAWDTKKPDGTPRKLLDISRLKALGWSPKIAMETGIRSTCKSYTNRLSFSNDL